MVGAGPAGLEAARVAAERGRRVEIVEASGVVGGQFRLAGMQPRRGQILELMDWYERQFDRLGVVLRLNTFLEAEEVAGHGASVVIVATGSLPDAYKVELENKHVKVVRVHYDAGAKLPEHTHPAGTTAYVYLNDSEGVIFSHVGGSNRSVTRPAGSISQTIRGAGSAATADSRSS